MKQNKWKQMISLLAACALLTGSLAACGSSSGGTASSGGADTGGNSAASSASSGNESAVASTSGAVDVTDGQTLSGDADVIIGTMSGSLCLVPLHIALDNGYFKEEFEKAGVTWRTEEIDINNAADLVASKKINACVGLAGSLIPQIDSGLDVSFTGGLHTGCTKYYTKADSGITSPEDLKGKKIGVPSLADSSVIALKRELFSQGIGVSTDNMEVEFVPYNLTDLPQALDNGAVDAVALHDPVAYQAEQEYGFTKIFDLSEDEPFNHEYCCQIFVSNELAKDNPEAAAAYTRALLKAAAFVQANPEQAAKIQIDNGQVTGDVETNSALLKSYNYTPGVQAAYQTFYDASDQLIEIGDLQEGRDIDEFAADHFKFFDGVPDSYTYNDDGTFTEVEASDSSEGAAQSGSSSESENISGSSAGSASADETGSTADAVIARTAQVENSPAGQDGGGCCD